MSAIKEVISISGTGLKPERTKYTFAVKIYAEEFCK